MKLLFVALALVALSSVALGGKWVQQIPSGPYFPPPRYFHSQAGAGNNAYIFGGEDGSSYFKDLFMYHTQQNYVERLDSGNGPSARAGHCAQFLGKIVDTYVDSDNVTQTVIVRNDTYVVFGGFDGTNYYNDIWEFNLGTGVWTQIDDGTDSDDAAARAFHTCVPFDSGDGSDNLLIFGGTDGSSYFGPSDLHYYNYDDGTWHTPTDNTPNGIYPAGRAYIQGVNNGDNLYFFGGYNADGCLADTWLWNSNLSAWFSVPTPDSPAPLAAYAGWGDGGTYEIFGGWSNCNAASSNLWSLSHSTPDWTLVAPSGITPPPRAATVGSFHGNDYLIYGGATGSLVNGTLTVTNVYDDLWLYRH